MALWIILLLALLAGAGACLAGLVLWKALLVFLGVFVGLNLLYVAFWYIVALTVDRSKPLEKQSAICRFGCASIAGWLSAWAGIHTTVSGEELLPTDTRFLLVSNHRSLFDPIVKEYTLRKYNLAFISKPSNMAIPVISNLAWGAGFLAIDRENDREALKTILQAADYLKRDICSMVIYPEGTRSKTGELGPFHAGSFKIAQRARVPVVIASIQGSEKALRHIPFHPTRVKLDILEVIPAETVKAMSTQELAEHSRDRIAKNLESTEGGK